MTVLDDWLVRTVGPLPMAAALGIAGAVYAGVGVAFPLAIGSNTAVLIGCNVIGAALAWTIALAWLLPLVEGKLRTQLLEQTTSLRSLSAAEFELVVGELLRREGWSVQETGRHGRPDGNVDLRIRHGDRERLVQCKRWDSRTVGVDEVRKLGGTLLREGLTGRDAVLVTASDFTAAAVEEARRTGIELVGSHELLRRLEYVGGMELLGRDSRAKTTYLCPNCASPMILGHSQHCWWVHCPSYYDGCKGKLDLGVEPRGALERLLAGGQH
jgi:hypothetical protein